MSEHSNGPPGPPPRARGPMPQWYPAVPRQPFRDRTTKLWAALVAGLVCLLVGIGVGFAIGHATSDDDRAPSRFQRYPGDWPTAGPDRGPSGSDGFGWSSRSGTG